MGGIGSGWKKEGGRKLAAEDVTRVDALKYGSGIVTRLTPTGGERKFGICAACGRGVRFLYIVQGVTACEKCNKLTRRSRQQSHTAREELRRAPELLGRALEAADNLIEAGAAGAPDPKEWSAAMRIIQAGAAPTTTTAPADALTSDIISANAVPPDATLQQRVIASDVAKTTQLLERIETMIESGEENYIDRSGITARVPLQTRSLVQLGNLWVSLSNARAARAGVATSIAADSSPPQSSLLSAIRASMKGQRDKDGYSIEELEAAAQGDKVLCAPPAPAIAETSGRTWDVPAVSDGEN